MKYFAKRDLMGGNPVFLGGWERPPGGAAEQGFGKTRGGVNKGKEVA